MPELPDVEYLRRYAEATSLHQTIDSTSIHDESLLEDTTPQLIARRLKHGSFGSARRHGKHLFLEIESGNSEPGVLMLHFGMTGTLNYSTEFPPDYTKFEVRFASGATLAYVNKRRLGRLGIAASTEEYVDSQELGPDALRATVEQLREVVGGGRGAVKSTLMNQSRLAGLGNIYTDEVLFQAGIDPRRECGTVSAEEVRAIHRTVRIVCEEAIRCHADPARMPETFLIRRRSPGAACPSCDGTVEKVTISGRSTYLCGACQG